MRTGLVPNPVTRVQSDVDLSGNARLGDSARVGKMHPKSEGLWMPEEGSRGQQRDMPMIRMKSDVAGSIRSTGG